MIENSIKQKKIVWVTPDCFVDVDFNINLLESILKEYSVFWIIILSNHSRFKEKDFKALQLTKGLLVSFVYNNFRQRDPRNIFFYSSLVKKIRYHKGDLIYLNLTSTSPYILLLYYLLPKYKTIYAAHDGKINSSFKLSNVAKITFILGYSTVQYVNMFSKFQEGVFLNNFPKKKVFITPLALKNFGESEKLRREDSIVFMFFGRIHKGKNLELLIKAGCQLWEEGIRGFKISINGEPDIDWKYYQNEIIYPEIFECNIKEIKNSEIPDLFTQAHYMVLPYKEMSQSGALKIAFHYNIPVIVSNLQGFTDEVKSGVNGFIFENENLFDLKDIIKTCIKNHNISYQILSNKMSVYTENNYSNDVISKIYIRMFNTVLDNNYRLKNI